MFISLSHDILREYREYERTSTTALNAYVGPRVRGYLDRLEGFLSDGKFGGTIQIMRSNGGTMSLSQARVQPVTMMESGPVAGMIAAGRIAEILGLEQCIGFDMGGTTAKASLITDGAPEVSEDYYNGGYSRGQPMQLPVVDIVEVGAGGGSIAWTDARGGLHVGPESAGADPGSRLLRQGRRHVPVVTDADLVLERLNAGRFLSGRMGLDPSAYPPPPSRRRSPIPLGLYGGRTRRSASPRSPMPPCRWRCGPCPSSAAAIRATPRSSPSAGLGRCMRSPSPARSSFRKGNHPPLSRQFFGARHAAGAVAAGLRPDFRWRSRPY